MEPFWYLQYVFYSISKIAYEVKKICNNGTKKDRTLVFKVRLLQSQEYYVNQTTQSSPVCIVFYVVKYNNLAVVKYEIIPDRLIGMGIRRKRYD